MWRWRVVVAAVATEYLVVTGAAGEVGEERLILLAVHRFSARAITVGQPWWLIPDPAPQLLRVAGVGERLLQAAMAPHLG